MIALPKKVSPGRQFTGKNPSRSSGRRAGRIFAGKVTVGKNFSGGDPVMEHWRPVTAVSSNR